MSLGDACNKRWTSCNVAKKWNGLLKIIKHAKYKEEVLETSPTLKKYPESFKKLKDFQLWRWI